MLNMLQLTFFYLILQLTCIYVSLCVYLFASCVFLVCTVWFLDSCGLVFEAPVRVGVTGPSEMWNTFTVYLHFCKWNEALILIMQMMKSDEHIPLNEQVAFIKLRCRICAVQRVWLGIFIWGKTLRRFRIRMFLKTKPWQVKIILGINVQSVDREDRMLQCCYIVFFCVLRLKINVAPLL